MKKIILHGHCSARYKWPTWADFIGLYQKGAEIVNLAKPGCGNESMARDVVNSVMKYSNIFHVYVMWGAPHRYEVISETTDKIENNNFTWSMWDPDFEWTVSYNGHWDPEQHRNYKRYFQTEKLNRYKTLENILYTQMFLDKHEVDYTMMVYDRRSLPVGLKSNSERALEKQIDWNKFKFYKDVMGLRDFGQHLYKEHFLDRNDNSDDPHTHPLPYIHYKWVKDVMFESDKDIDQEQYDRLKSWKSLEIDHKEWMDEAKAVPQWENNA